MSYIENYHFQALERLTGSERRVLNRLEVGCYTVIYAENRIALLFARTAPNFGLVMRITEHDTNPKQKQRIYAHYEKGVIVFFEEEDRGHHKAKIKFLHPVSRRVNKLITRVIHQEIGGHRCNDSKMVEIHVSSHAKGLPLHEGKQQQRCAFCVESPTPGEGFFGSILRCF